MKHRTVDEIWEFTEGRGELWLKSGDSPEDLEKTIFVTPGVKVEIKKGWHFQFRNVGEGPFEFLVVTNPVWPGPHEAVPVEDHWLLN